MDERLRLSIIAGEGTEVFCGLCKEYGISPKTGYKWLRRYEQPINHGSQKVAKRAKIRWRGRRIRI